ncbi:response regulator [Allorhodopirellula solitaria]|uniref:Regulator of RpoS n=1 Tax=Allorhodopirellula solitaria TaxID=2527987 RepID=A0A5C5YKD6_9BACT|nr:response regulator [Allorhodopirellula solitaria]TWT75334.1 Regulator of RpoS [Allorhodopirellula solitaria]
MEKKTAARRCVIADDIRSSREMLSRWMKEIGFEVLTGADGGEAWEHLQRTTSDLLITDLEMPDMSGLELIRRLRREGDAGQRQLPVMIITSLSDQKMSSIARDFAAATVVFKPIAKATFLDIAQKLVRHEKVKDVYESNRIGGGGVAGISPSLRALIDQNR